jgi:acylphosphatase
LGLSGWVRNLPDGDVELLAEGPTGALAELRSWLDEGPPGASIQSVRVERLAPTGLYQDFSIEN